jgi:hypothetical protein
MLDMNSIDTIIEFLDEWLGKNGTIEAADTAKLSQFMSELGSEIDNLSMVPGNGGTNLILYAGANADAWMWQYAEGASSVGQGYYFISNTPAGKVLVDDDVWKKIGDICDGDNDLRNRIFGNKVGEARSAYVIGDQLALNDRISANLAKNASGNVTIWAPNGTVNTVLPDTELRIVLTDSDITSINGISKDVFLDRYRDSIGNPDFVFNDTKALEQSGVNDVYESIKRSLPEDYFDSAAVHYNSEGKITKIYTTSITGGEFTIEPKDSAFSSSIYEIRGFASDADMSAKFQDYNALSSLEKLQARRGNDIYSKLGIDAGSTIFSETEIAVHMAIIGDNPGELSKAKIYFDGNGKIAAIEQAKALVMLESKKM